MVEYSTRHEQNDRNICLQLYARDKRWPSKRDKRRGASRTMWGEGKKRTKYRKADQI